MNIKSKLTAGLLCMTLGVGALFTGCGGVNEKSEMITINNGESSISAGYYNFVAKYTQATYDLQYTSMLGEGYWAQSFGSEGTMEDSVKNNIVDNLIAMHLSEKHAEEYGIKIDDAQQKKIDEAAKAFLDNNKKKTIRELGAKEEYVKEYLKQLYISNKVQKAIRDELDVQVSDEEANQATISYVFFSTGTTTDPNTGEEVPKTADELKTAEENANAMAAAEDYDAKAEELGTNVSSHSYTISADAAEDTTLPAEVITAAKALTEGQISEVIKIDGEGYYVIRKDKDLDTEATASNREQLEETKRSEHYDEVLEQWKAEITWTVNDKELAKVKFDKMFEMSESMIQAQQEMTETNE